MIPPFPSDLQPRSMGKIFLTFQLVDRQFCGGETREGKGKKKMSSTDMYDDRVKSTRPLSLKEMDIYARLVWCLSRVHARRHARNGRLNNSIRSPPLHIIYSRSYNAIREHICHFACPVIILSVKLCGSFSLMLQRRLIQATLLYTSVCAYFNKSSCPWLASS